MGSNGRKEPPAGLRYNRGIRPERHAMSIVKCPNPSCPFQFDASLVPPGAVIACPQCRLQFQLPQVAAAPPPAAAEPEVLDADALPTDTTPARGERRRDRDKGDADGKGGRGRRSRDDDAPPRKKGSMALILVVVAVGVALICCGGGAGLMMLIASLQKKPSNTSPYTYPDYALSYSGPGEGWEEDKETQNQWKFRLAGFKSKSPEGYIAVQVMKTEGEAGKGDLLPAAVAALKDKFDDLDEKLTPTEAKLLGATAEKYEFTGVYKTTDTGCRGEVYAVAVRNLKVWVYCWAERDKFGDLAPAFEGFRAGMKLETKANETKIQRQVTPFRTNSGLYTLTDTEGLWKKQEDPTRQDAAADLWLAGFKRDAASGQLKTKPTADLVVATIEPKGDAKTQAKAHILEQFADGAATNVQDGDPVGETPSSGAVAASDSVMRMTMKYPGADRSIEKMMVYSVIDTGGKRVVAYGWCQLGESNYWEQRLMLLVGTLKPLK